MIRRGLHREVEERGWEPEVQKRARHERVGEVFEIIVMVMLVSIVVLGAFGFITWAWMP